MKKILYSYTDLGKNLKKCFKKFKLLARSVNSSGKRRLTIAMKCYTKAWIDSAHREFKTFFKNIC